MGWVNSGRVLSPHSWECLPLWFGQSSAFTGAFLAVLGHCCVLSFNSVCAPGREFRHGKGIPSGMRSFSSPTASLAPLSHSVVLRNEQMRAVHLHPPSIRLSVCPCSLFAPGKSLSLSFTPAMGHILSHGQKCRSAAQHRAQAVLSKGQARASNCLQLFSLFFARLSAWLPAG